MRVKVESGLPHSEQGMYENSCINLSSSPAPDSGRDQRKMMQKEVESDEQNKANPTPASLPLAPTSLGAGTHRGQEAGRAGRGGALWSRVRPALAGPFPFLGLCGGSDMDEAGLRH